MKTEIEEAEHPHDNRAKDGPLQEPCSASRDDLGVAYLTPKLLMLVMSAVLLANERDASLMVGYFIMAAVWCWLVARHIERLTQKPNDEMMSHPQKPQA